MLHYHPADCLEKDTCVLCGDDDIVYVDTLTVPWRVTTIRTCSARTAHAWRGSKPWWKAS